MRVTGPVQFNSNGDRSGYFDIFNFGTTSSVIAAVYDPDTNNVLLLLFILLYPTLLSLTIVLIFLFLQVMRSE